MFIVQEAIHADYVSSHETREEAIAAIEDLIHAGLAAPGDFNIRERKYVQLRLEAYGVTNSPQWGVPSTSFGSTSFGQITSAGGARTVQVAIKGYF